MVDVAEVAENIYMIDDELYSISGLGSVYLVNEEKKALIDSGPATSAKAVLDGIRRVGVSPEDIDYLIVTHIHLDHSGGAGVLIRDMPRAQAMVHHRGARYLVNPERLVSSVIAAQGEGSMAKYGEVAPIEAGRVKSVRGGEVLRLSERQSLRFIDAPGHAPHEICVQESRNNGLFAGDAAGIYLGEYGIMLPVTPLPSFDAELFIDTVERLMGLGPARIYFAHFGATDKVQDALQLSIDKVRELGGLLADAIKNNGFDGAAEKLAARAIAELEPIRHLGVRYKHLAEFIAPMNARGYIKYYRDKHELS